MIRRFAAHGATPPGHPATRHTLVRDAVQTPKKASEVEMEALATHACGAANSRYYWRSRPRKVARALLARAPDSDSRPAQEGAIYRVAASSANRGVAGAHRRPLFGAAASFSNPSGPQKPGRISILGRSRLAFAPWTCASPASGAFSTATTSLAACARPSACCCPCCCWAASGGNTASAWWPPSGRSAWPSSTSPAGRSATAATKCWAAPCLESPPSPSPGWPRPTRCCSGSW